MRRWREMKKAAKFFRALWDADIEKICVENPIQHGYVKDWIGVEPSQIIHPWQFGEGETKATCLWLKNLPLLMPTKIVSGRKPVVHYASPGPDRGDIRGKTYQGIANALASQYGDPESNMKRMFNRLRGKL